MNNIINFALITWCIIHPIIIIYLYNKMMQYKTYWQYEKEQSDMYSELYETEHKYVKVLEQKLKNKPC